VATHRGLLGPTMILAIVAVLAITGATIAATREIADRSHHSGDEAAAATDRPVAATLDLTPLGKARWDTTLGPDCNMEKVPLLVLGRNAQGYEVVTIPGDCDLNRFTVVPEDGALRTNAPLTRED
jgi:hypothetical protein